MYMFGNTVGMVVDEQRIGKDFVFGEAATFGEAVMKLSKMIIEFEEALIKPLGYIQDFPSKYPDRYCLATYTIDEDVAKVVMDFCIKEV